MQLANGFAKFTKQEELTVIDRCIHAKFLVNEDWQQRNLTYVTKYFLEENKDISIAVWEIFLNVLVDLGIDPPVVKLNDIHPGKGSIYTIPMKDGDLKRKRLLQRKRWRQKAREESEQRYWCMYGDRNLKLVISN